MPSLLYLYHLTCEKGWNCVTFVYGYFLVGERSKGERSVETHVFMLWSGREREKECVIKISSICFEETIENSTRWRNPVEKNVLRVQRSLYVLCFGSLSITYHQRIRFLVPFPLHICVSRICRGLSSDALLCRQTASGVRISLAYYLQNSHQSSRTKAVTRDSSRLAITSSSVPPREGVKYSPCDWLWTAVRIFCPNPNSRYLH